MSASTAALEAGPAPDQPLATEDGEGAPPSLPWVAAGAALAGAAGAWMVGGLFRQPAARGVGMIGVLLGAGLVWAAFRYRHRLAAASRVRTDALKVLRAAFPSRIVAEA